MQEAHRRGDTVARIVVLGAGLVGGFVVSKLEEHEVTVVDLDSSLLNRMNCKVICADALSSEVLDIEGVDVWVNMLPGGIADKVRKPLLDRNQTVVDLAFTMEDPRIHSTGRMVYDVGIAPGLSNLWTAALKDALKVEILVGGIPAEPDDGWSYMAPFSPADVIEEYTRPARVKIDGEFIELEALEMRHLCEFPHIGTLEAAVTDGLRSLLDTVEAETMLEYTLRWPGHYDKWLSSSGDEELIEEWKFDSNREEMTILSIKAQTAAGEWNGFLLDRGDQEWSSMARTTGLVTLAAIDAALAGLIPEGVSPPEGIPELLQLAERRLLDAGVQIERDSL